MNLEESRALPSARICLKEICPSTRAPVTIASNQVPRHSWRNRLQALHSWRGRDPAVYIQRVQWVKDSKFLIASRDGARLWLIREVA